MGPRNPNAKKQIADIEAQAMRELSSYEGRDIMSYEGNDIDDDLDFGGRVVGGFSSEDQTGQSFTFTLENQGSTPLDRVIALNPGQFDAEADLVTAGYPAAGILRDGQVVPGATVGTNDVVATPANPKRTIDAFLKFAYKNSLRITGMTIQSDDPDQFNTNLDTYVYSPFRDLGSDYIRIEDYYDPDQFSSKKVEMNLLASGHAFQFDDQSIVLMKLLKGRKVTITFHVGAVNNQAKKLAKKAARFHAGHTAQLARMKGRTV